jgi:hypothetical protein
MALGKSGPLALAGPFDSDTATGMMPVAQRVAGVLTYWRS